MKKLTQTLCAIAYAGSLMACTSIAQENSTQQPLAQAMPATIAPSALSLVKIWEIDGFDLPESVLADPNSDWIYVSNVNGKGNGFISRISQSGKLDALHWVDGIQRPTGMALYQGKLYVVNNNEIVVINTQTAKIEQRIRSAGKMLNDIAVNNEGTFYIGDLVTGGIFTFKVGDTQTQRWLDNEILKHPNGLLIDGDNLIVGTVGLELRPQLPPHLRGSLYRVNLKNKQVQMITATEHLGNLDGLMKLNQSLITTGSSIGNTFVVTKDDKAYALPQPIAGGITDGSLLNNTLYAPYMSANKLVAYRLDGTLVR